MKFEAPWDTSLKKITYAVAVFFVVEAIGISIALFFTTTRTMAFLVTVMIVICNTLILVFTNLYAPKGYMVDESGVTMVRGRAVVHIDFDSIQQVSRIERDRFIKRSWGTSRCMPLMVITVSSSVRTPITSSPPTARTNSLRW